MFSDRALPLEVRRDARAPRRRGRPCTTRSGISGAGRIGRAGVDGSHGSVRASSAGRVYLG